MTILSLIDFSSYYRSEMPGDDPLAQMALDAGIAVVKSICKRSFDVASAVSSARSYTPDGSRVLRIHDCTSIVSVTEAGSALTAGTGFQAETKLGTQTIAWEGDTLPYERIRRLDTCWYTDRGTPTVTVTALWGMAAVPSVVPQAAAIAASDFYDMRDVRLGVLVITEAGVARVRQNTTVLSLLNEWRRVEATFGIAG